VGQLDGITSELVFTQSEFHPNLRLIWNKNKYKVSPQQVKQALLHGEPSIEVVRLSLAEGNLEISAWMLEPGEERTVAKRVREIFTAAI
jgi:L-seryl-tRNA(Ser) seleniumtransferase